jgi:RHS repeat-associated protein
VVQSLFSGNVLYENNLLNSTESELLHANSAASGDNNTAYDPLSRLTDFERGTLSSSGNNGSTLDTVASATDSQSFNLSAVGDQSSVTTNGTTTTNSTNAKNELTTNGANSLTFDNNGNTLTDENGQSYTYNAWNQIVTAKNSSGVTIADYGYDAQGRRITESDGTTTTAIYFSDQWQAIEERVGGTVTLQNVWGLGYVNQLVERDDNSVSGTLGISGSGLGERLYAQQDAGWNVTSLVDTSGDVVERMTYSPYGAVSFLTAGWAPTSDAYGQNVLFQGGRLETATGNYIFDYRDYDPNTGTWKEQDPAGYVNGPNLYQLETSNPGTRTDPAGLMAGAIALIATDPAEGSSFGPIGAAGGILIGAAMLGANAIDANSQSSYNAAMAALNNPSNPNSQPNPNAPGGSAATGAGAGNAAAGAGAGQNPGATAPVVPAGPVPAITAGWDGTTAPGPGWEWRGAPGSKPGPCGQGNWYNKATGESLNADPNHAPPIGPHNDWIDSNGNGWRVYPDGRVEPKN